MDSEIKSALLAVMATASGRTVIEYIKKISNYGKPIIGSDSASIIMEAGKQFVGNVLMEKIEQAERERTQGENGEMARRAELGEYYEYIK